MVSGDRKITDCMFFCIWCKCGGQGPPLNCCSICLPRRHTRGDAYVSLASEHMQQAYKIVRKQLQTNFDRAKRHYDEHVKSTKFREGEFVWHFVPRTVRGRTRSSCWRTGDHTALWDTLMMSINFCGRQKHQQSRWTATPSWLIGAPTSAIHHRMPAYIPDGR